jgi:hypothetical protein
MLLRYDSVWILLRYYSVWMLLRYYSVRIVLRYDSVWILLRYDSVWILLRYDSVWILLRYDSVWILLRYDSVWILLRYDSVWILLRYNTVWILLRYDSVWILLKYESVSLNVVDQCLIFLKRILGSKLGLKFVYIYDFIPSHQTVPYVLRNKPFASVPIRQKDPLIFRYLTHVSFQSSQNKLTNKLWIFLHKFWQYFLLFIFK